MGKDEYSVYFSEVEKWIIKNSPVKKLTKSEERKERMKCLLTIRKEMKDDEKAYKWSTDMIWNESVGFVKLMITKYKTPGIMLYSDLMGECANAILANIDKYDPDKATFSTFLTIHLVHAISEYITKDINKTSSYYAVNVRKVENAIQYFARNGIMNPTKTDISMYTKLSIHKVEDALANINGKHMLSIDDDSIRNIPSSYENPLNIAINNDLSRVISEAVESLGNIESKIIRLYYDLDETNGKMMTIAGVAKKLNMTAAEVGKILRKAEQKLRKNKALRDFCKPNYTEVHKRDLLPNTKKIDEYLDDFIESFLPDEKLLEDSDTLEKKPSDVDTNSGIKDIKW